MDICYCEKHHIIPKCLHGTNDNSNLINLTGREHYICHILLSKIYKGTEYEHKLLCAVTYCLKGCKIHDKLFKYNSRLIGLLKERKAYVSSKKFKYKGDVCTLREFSRKYKIKYNTLRNRVKTMSLKEAIEKEPKEKLHTVNGEKLTYHQIAKKYNIEYCVLVDRVACQGMTIEQAINTQIRKPQTIYYNNKHYTISEVSKITGKSISCITRRINAGYTPEQIFKFDMIAKINYNGENISYYDLAKKYNLNIQTVRSRIKAGIPLEQKLRVKEHKFLIGGEYYTYKQLAEKFNISVTVLKSRIKSGYSIEEAINFKPYSKKLDHGYKIEYKGEIHNIYNWSKRLGIPYSILYQRIKRQGLSFEQAIEKPIRNKKYEYNGVFYTLTELSVKFNKNRRTLQDRIMRRHMRVEDAIK